MHLPNLLDFSTVKVLCYTVASYSFTLTYALLPGHVPLHLTCCLTLLRLAMTCDLCKVQPADTVQRESLANRLFSSIWQKKVWQINRSTNRLSIVSANLDGFSLANHGRFAKFAKLFPRQTFPLYGTTVLIFGFLKGSYSDLIKFNWNMK